MTNKDVQEAANRKKGSERIADIWEVLQAVNDWK